MSSPRRSPNGKMKIATANGVKRGTAEWNRKFASKKIYTANGKKRGSLEYQSQFSKKFEIEEKFKTKEELLADPNICERVKKLIRKSSSIAQRTPEWFRMRRDKLTGSAIAACIGTCKYTTRDQLMLNKLGLGKKFQGNQATLRGQQLEPHAAVAYQKKSGNRLIEYDLGLLEHDDHDEIAASPDGVTTTGILIEIKCPLRRKIIPGVVPLHYVAQIQVLMEIMNLEKAHFVDFKPKSMYGDEVCEITLLKRDRAWFSNYFPTMREFVHEMRANRTNGFIERYHRQHRVLDIGMGPKPKEKKDPDMNVFNFIGTIKARPKKKKLTMKAENKDDVPFGFI